MVSEYFFVNEEGANGEGASPNTLILQVALAVLAPVLISILASPQSTGGRPSSLHESVVSKTRNRPIKPVGTRKKVISNKFFNQVQSYTTMIIYFTSITNVICNNLYPPLLTDDYAQLRKQAMCFGSVVF